MSFKSFLFLCLIIFNIIITILYFFPEENKKMVKKIIKNGEMPLIVLCTNFYETKFLNFTHIDALNKCPFKCQISDDLSLYPEADVAVFHARDMYYEKQFQDDFNSEQLKVIYTIEAFPHERIRRKHFPKNFFNATMSFRKDSTVWKPYDQFEKITNKDPESVWSEKEIKEELSKKTKIALQLVSHCETHSLREKYVEKMEEFLNITTLGSCNNNAYGNEKDILAQHNFYLAFENAVCKDYVTEKFWRIKQLIVPVVLKREILRGIVEDEYFIAADDFKTPKELADRLIYLSKNLEEYKKYLGWTKKYKKTSVYDEKEFCKLCEMAVKKEKHSIEDIYSWWEKESECQFNYFNYTLQDFQ